VFDICKAQTFQALRDDVGSSSQWTQDVLTGPEFEALGPALDDIVVHAEGRNFQNNYAFEVVLQYRYDEGPWDDSASSVVIAKHSTQDYDVSAPFADRQYLGRRKIRLVLRSTYTTGGASGARGDLSLSVACRFFD